MVASERSGTIAKRRAPAGSAVAITVDVVADVAVAVTAGVEGEAAGAAQDTAAMLTQLGAMPEPG